MNTRAFFTLLVVLALSAWLLTGPVGSAVRYERAGERLCEIDEADDRDNDDLSGGDDDRWGDADPWDGDPETSVPEDGTGGDEGESCQQIEQSPALRGPVEDGVHDPLHALG